MRINDAKNSSRRDFPASPPNSLGRTGIIRSNKWQPDESYWRHHFSSDELTKFIDFYDKLAGEADARGETVRRNTYRAHVLNIAIALSKRKNLCLDAATAEEKSETPADAISQAEAEQILQTRHNR